MSLTPHASLVLIFVDLDGFKQAIDVYGRDQGNQVLEETPHI
jgi:GGDEF domain-containing protein